MKTNNMLILIFCIFFLTACEKRENFVTISYIPLSKSEQAVASLGERLVKKFRFEKNKSYDIKINCYKKGIVENISTITGIQCKENNDILIGRIKDPQQGVTWNVSYPEGSISSALATKIDNLGSLSNFSGNGQVKYELEENKEYILMYDIYTINTYFEAKDTEIFSNWSESSDHGSSLKKFDYVYTVTAKLNSNDTDKQSN